MLKNLLKGAAFLLTNKEDGSFMIDPIRSFITYYMSPILPAVYRLYYTEDDPHCQPLPVSENFYDESGTEKDFDCEVEETKDGVAFLILHGFCDTAHTTKAVASHFNKLGYSTYSPRLAGHGLMSYSEIPTKNLKTEMVNGVYEKYLQVIAKKDVKKVVIIGYSMGGSLATALHRKIKVRKAENKIHKTFLINPAVHHLPKAQKLIEYFGEFYEKFPGLPFPRLNGDPIDPYYSASNYGYSCINGAITIALNSLMTEAKVFLKHMFGDVHLITGEYDNSLDSSRWDDVFEAIGAENKTMDVISGGGHCLMNQATITNDDGTKSLKSALLIEKYLTNAE